MSRKSWISLIVFVGATALGMWYFEDMRSQQEKAGRISVAPSE